MKMRDYDAGRIDGLRLAQRIVHEGGEEELAAEIKRRTNGGINTSLTAKEMDIATKGIKETCIDTMMTMSLYTLRDGFGFGEKRMQDFYDRFMLKTDMMLQRVVDFPEVKKTLLDEVGFDIDMHLAESGVELWRKKLGIEIEPDKGAAKNGIPKQRQRKKNKIKKGKGKNGHKND